MSRAGSRSNGRSRSQDEPIAIEDDVVEVHENGAEEAGDDEDDEVDEDEYEVEAICDHRLEKKGKYKYLVAWKGYGPEHNTWEPAENVEHAEEIVKLYWAKVAKSSVPVTGTIRKRGRESSVTSPAKPKKPKATRHPRTAAGASQSGDDAFVDFEQSHVDDVDKYEDIQNWEPLVKSIDTIERSSDNKLIVYMTMSAGERIAQTTDVVYKRCPQQVLKFYESHLKWKA